MPERVLPVTPAIVPPIVPVAPVCPVVVEAAVVVLRVLKLEDDRWRREGVGLFAPDAR